MEASSKSNPGLDGAGLGFGLIALAGWTAYVVVARHGALAGFSPLDLAVARLVPAGLVFLPYLLQVGIADLGGIGWRRGLTLALFGGPGFGFLMAGGFTLAPVTHGAVIGPAVLTLGTTVLSIAFLSERPGALRLAGLGIIVAGILLVGGGAFLTPVTGRILLGDLCLVAANLFFAVFAILLRVWSVPPLKGAAVVTVLSLFAMLPVYLVLADIDAIAAIGWDELALQWLGQGVFAGCIATAAFMAAVARLGPSRGAVFPSAIPATAVLAGAPLLGEYPSAIQIVGVAVTSAGLVLAVGLLNRRV
ncbi:MAG: DMT family transporter [Minwuia sp.]|uniref:DMT family transporter n=1 Tax=Minwuia sp. TaxID=2493630 RepID=UPI003A8C3E23